MIFCLNEALHLTTTNCIEQTKDLDNELVDLSCINYVFIYLRT